MAIKRRTHDPGLKAAFAQIVDTGGQSSAKLRNDIEIGWLQSERGEVVNGPAVFKEIREMSKAGRKGDKSRKK